MSRSVVSATRVAHPPTTPTRTRASIEGRPQGVTPTNHIGADLRVTDLTWQCGRMPQACRKASVAAFPGHYAIACAGAQNRGSHEGTPASFRKEFLA